MGEIKRKDKLIMGVGEPFTFALSYLCRFAAFSWLASRARPIAFAILMPSPHLSGKHVTVNVGEPIEIPKELCARCYAAGFEQEELWGQITRVIEAAMQEMEASSPPNVDQRSPEQQRHGDGSASVVAAEPKPA